MIMWWIIGIFGFVTLIILWVIVRGASQSIDEDTQAMLDEEQSRYIAEYFREKEEKERRNPK